MLPSGSGIDELVNIRKEKDIKDIKTVLLTAIPVDLVEKKKLEKLRIAAYVEKPSFNLDEFTGLIDGLVH